MKWALSEPKLGDMIRVNTGLIFHYGIYVDDDRIIQFGLPPAARPGVKDCDVEVCTSDIGEFLRGGFLEVAIPDRKEEKKRLNPTKTVEYAKSRLGQRGYDVLRNNCEHFAYECFLGERRCTQTDVLEAILSALPTVDVFVAAVPDATEIPTPHCRARRADISNCTNLRVKREKAFAWALLEYAAEVSFKANARKIKFEKQQSGKWTCPDFFFSLTHTDGAVAVAVSKSPVGIDAEWTGAVKHSLCERILTDKELTAYEGLEQSEKPLFLTKSWTVKESVFKKEGGVAFSPAGIEASAHKHCTRAVSLGGRELILSVATDTPDSFKIYTVDYPFKRRA